MSQANAPLLEVENLEVTLKQKVHAVAGVSLSVAPGEMLGIVGESGSGKSMTLRAVTGLIPPDVESDVRGVARFDGQDLIGLSAAQTRKICARSIGFVFQDPLSSLNPGFRIAWQLDEALRHRSPELSKAARRARIVESIERVELPSADRVLRCYPHELSGGMRQRVMIGMALLSRPRLLLADEPTTALDVTLSAEILDLICGLQRDDDLATVLISHDLNLVAARCDRVIVMYAGKVVETGNPDELFARPQHPYTRRLLAATVDPFRPVAPVAGAAGNPSIGPTAPQDAPADPVVEENA